MVSMVLHEYEKAGIAERIRWFRLAKKLTQEQLGIALGAGTAQSAKAMVAKIERGQVPGGLRLRRLVETLGCSSDILLSGKSRELMELVRYYIPLPEGMDKYCLNALRVGRIFIFTAISSGHTEHDGEFVEAANRMFYLAENDAQACRSLFVSMGGGRGDKTADLLTAKGDLRGLVRHAMREASDGADPVAYKTYRVAIERLDLIVDNYIRPEEPSLSAAIMRSRKGDLPPVSQSPKAPGIIILSEKMDKDGLNPAPSGVRELEDGVSIIKVDSSRLEPIARKGQFVMLAPEKRHPLRGDLVVCWREGEIIFGRLVRNDDIYEIASLDPTDYKTVRLSPDTIACIRKINGVWFE
ncbi:MAG: helix-turn-helix transcriptional regulator [Planctomycetes bacterium]|nr:helix-turn-helix transcriptional regulator [Planctomycetota bacterium]